MKRCFVLSAIIPVILGFILYFIMVTDLLGNAIELRSPEYYEDIDIYSVELGHKVVKAKTYEGAMYGLGFIHARDRLW